MSKTNFNKVFAALCLMCLLHSLSALDTKLSGEFWGRMTNETARYKNAAGDYVDKTSKNYFSLERGYLGLETTFSASTKARFTVDMFSSDATHQYPADAAMPIDSLKNASIDGAGLKLKYGYVDFANLLPVPDLNLTVGLQKTYFGTIYDWNYTGIEKAPTDLYKVVNSSDYGVTLNGFVPHGLGEYALGVYNGEGYKKVGGSLADNISFAYLANLRLTPMPGITLGGSFMANSAGREKALSGDAANSKYEEQSLYDGLGRLAYGPVDLWLEYIGKDVKFPHNAVNDYTATGISIMPVVSLNSMLDLPLELIGRYDRWDESDRPLTDKARSLLNTMIVGVNYNFLPDGSDIPQMAVQLNYADRKYDADKSSSDYANGKKDSSQIMLQLKWKFASIITN